MRHAWTRLFGGLETFLMKRKKKNLATPSWCKFLFNAAPGGQSLSLPTLRGQLLYTKTSLAIFEHCVKKGSLLREVLQ